MPRPKDSQQQSEAAALHPNDLPATPEISPQPEQQQAPTADQKVAKLLQDNPELLGALQAEVGRYEQAAQQVIAANAQAAVASLVASFPELAGVRGDQIPAAIAVVNNQNPERAKAMLDHIEQVSRLVGQHQQVQAQQQRAWMAEYSAEFEREAKAADAEFVARNPMSNEEHSELQQETLAMLRDYGLSDERINLLWHTDKTFRSFPSQAIMRDAVRYRQAKRSAPTKLVRDAPAVFRPGSPLSRGSEEEYQTQKLNQRINQSKGLDQVRAAAELIAARRRAAGR